MEQYTRRQGFRLMLGATQAALLGAAGCPSLGYAGIVTGIPGLVGYWRFSSAEGLFDQTANQRHGTYDGAVSLVDPLASDSDAATHLAGTVKGTIPHDAGLQLPSLSLSIWFSADAIDVTNILVSKDDTGFDNGDFSLQVQPDGILRAVLQSGGETQFVEVAGIQAATAYHVVFVADDTGFGVWLNGRLREFSTATTEAWVNNNVNIELGSVFWTARLLAGMLDEMGLYNRVLSDTEIIALSQVTAVPVVVNGQNTVEDGAAVTLSLLDDCTFVGRKSDLTVQVSPAGAGVWGGSAATTHGTVSVNASNDLVFTAGSVSGNQNDTFDYRIIDANGTSSAGTVDILVQEASVASDPLAQCFVITGSTVDVNTSAEFDAAIAGANSGGPKIIRIEPGSYSWGTKTFTITGGTEAAPVIITPRDGYGTVTFNDTNLRMSGSRGVIEKLIKNDGEIRATGAFHRVSRCKFTGIDTPAVYVKECSDLRVNHCEFTDYEANSSNLKNGIFIENTGFGTTTKRILIDYCYFHDIFQNVSIGRSNPIWTSSGGVWNKDAEIVIDHCLFKDINRTGSGETLVIKNSGAKVRFCTFDNCVGEYLQQRQGSGWEVRSCWFEDCASDPLKTPDDNGVAGYAPLVIGNRIVGSGMWIYPGTSATPGPNSDNGGIGYHACIGGQFVGNNCDGTIYVGRGWSSQPVIVQAQNNNLWGNTSHVIQNATGTTFNNPALSYDAAVKLVPANVGVSVADPLCP